MDNTITSYVSTYYLWLHLFFRCAEGGMVKNEDAILEPREITQKELQLVHTEEYLDSLTVRL